MALAHLSFAVSLAFASGICTSSEVDCAASDQASLLQSKVNISTVDGIDERSTQSKVSTEDFEQALSGHRGVWIHTELTGSAWGSWRKEAFCPEGERAIGFTVRYENYKGCCDRDNTALNSVALRCGTERSANFDRRNNLGYRASSYDGKWGYWVDGQPQGYGRDTLNYPFTSKCSKSGFIDGYALSNKPHGGDDIAAARVMFHCTTGEKPQIRDWHKLNGPSFKWPKLMAKCQPGYVANGIKIKFESDQGGGDDTAMGDMKLHCVPQAVFTEGRSNSNSCKSGSQPIGKKECTAAASQHKGGHMKAGSIRNGHDPKGCFRHKHVFYFNTHPSGRRHRGRYKICKRAPMRPAAVIVKIGRSRKNNKRCVKPPPHSGTLLCARDAGNRGKRVTNRNRYSDTFLITTTGSEVCARRTDSSAGWGMDLHISCQKAHIITAEDGCATGSDPLTEDDCKIYAQTWEFAKGYGGQINKADRPKGCFGRNNIFYFNVHGTGRRSKADYFLCKAVL